MTGEVDRAEACDSTDMFRVTINSGVGVCGSWSVRRWCVEAGARRGLAAFMGKSGLEAAAGSNNSDGKR